MGFSAFASTLHTSFLFSCFCSNLQLHPVNSRFITPDDGLFSRDVKDVFVHISGILNSVPLQDGECVEFSTEITSKGVRAVDAKQLNTHQW